MQEICLIDTLSHTKSCAIVHFPSISIFHSIQSNVQAQISKAALPVSFGSCSGFAVAEVLGLAAGAAAALEQELRKLNWNKLCPKVKTDWIAQENSGKI